jgi:hypothetical protein
VPSMPYLRFCRTSLAPSALALAALLLLPAAGAAASGNCTGTSADTWIDYAFWNNDVLTAEGAWQVNGATSARVQYFVDGTLYQTSTASGSSGAWNWFSFSDDFEGCGNHTFKVKACPRVWDGYGYTVCETHCDESSTVFSTEACAATLSVSFQCSLSGPNGVVGVQGTILSGNPPYKVETYVPSAWTTKYGSTTSTGPFSYSNRCSYAGYKVGLRITDDDGQVKTEYCYCDLLE